MSETLQRTFPAELASGDGRTVEGCVVPYGKPSTVRDGTGPPYLERFDPGAFHKQVRAANRINLRFEHDTGLMARIGKCRELEERPEGLYGAFAVTDSQPGDHALALVRQGVVTGFSVGFTDRFERWTREGDVVVRQSCTLHEVSLCEEPAHAGAAITGMRSREVFERELGLEREDEELLERLRSVGIIV